MRYQVTGKYSARRDGRQFGPWQAGDVVELDGADAEWVERDAPGTLTREAKAKPPPANRQHRGGANRSA